MAISLKLAAVAAVLVQGVSAFWRLPCGVIQTARLDPIINPGTVSGHVHKISGPPNFSPSSTYDSLFNSRCTSCEVQADKSAYWTLYYQHKNGSFEEVPAGGMVVYYLGRGENTSNIHPFPKGFQMVSGNPAARSYDNTTYTFGGVDGVIYTGGHCQTGDGTCVGGTFVNRTGTRADPKGPVFRGRPVSDRVSFACLDDTPSQETPSMSKTSCSNGMRAQIQFPSCWDGVNPFLPGSKHVNYMSQIDNGVCPPTHPISIPHLFFEVLYGVTDVSKDGGQFVFAMGDPTGYGFHGDFINAWDPTVLSDAIDQCIVDDTSGQISDCAPLVASVDQFNGYNCPPQPGYYDEDVRGMIGTKLPGCNKITYGPAPASSSDLTCPPGTKLPSQNTSYDFNGGSTPTNPAVGSVSNGYRYAGCFADDSGHSFAIESMQQDNMTNSICQAFCTSQNLPLAATEYSDECYCGYSLNPAVNTNTTCAAMICAGNATEFCGGPKLLSVYNSTTYKGTYNPIQLTPGQDTDGGFTYLGCASEATTGRALNVTSTRSTTNMTNDLCASFCAAANQPLFGTEFGSECYCGSTLAAGSQLGQSGCTNDCSGPGPISGPFANYVNICGGSKMLSVWKNRNVGGSSGASSQSSAAAQSSTSSATVVTSAKASSATKQPTTSTIVADVTTVASATTLATSRASSTLTSSSSPLSSISSSRTTSSAATSFPSAPANVGSNITYLGCYTEASDGRALNVTNVNWNNMTNAACASYCASQSLPLFGTEFGQQCYCGNVPDAGSSLSSSPSDCSVPCVGPSPSSKPFAALPNVCGGSSRLTLWNNTAVNATANKARVVPANGAKTYKYKGCYAESGSGGSRLLGDASTSSNTAMSVDACVAFCNARGLPVAGTEYGAQCFCAATLPASAAKADEWDCDMQCPGDLGRWCGGSARLSVYSAS